MATTPKIVLSRSQDIPFNKLVLSQANVRRVKAGVSVEALAESIARHSLLQSLTVRPVLDADGQETGMFEVPVGGRRFRALELLVAQKRISLLHREFRYPLQSSSRAVSGAIPRLSLGLSHLTHLAACAPFTPSESLPNYNTSLCLLCSFEVLLEKFFKFLVHTSYTNILLK